MDVTITLTDEQAAHGALITDDLPGLCSRLISNEAA